MAKNFLLSSEQKLDRKLKEAILAIRIERAYSKDKILELYLNEIYLGMGSYGVAAAALNYFSKELSELTIEEAAYLAALPKAPNNYHPFRRAKEATIRRDWIIDQMADVGYITGEQAKGAKAKPLKVNIRPFGTQIYAADYFAEDVRRTLVGNFGEDGLYGRAERAASATAASTAGCRCSTTLDPNLQRLARRALIDGLVAFDREQGLARAGAEDRHRRRLGRGADRHRGPRRPAAVAPRRRARGADAPRPWSGCARRARPTAASWQEREAVEIPFDEVQWAQFGSRRPQGRDRCARRRRRDLGGAQEPRHSRPASGR